jgi:hypothetical protein
MAELAEIAVSGKDVEDHGVVETDDPLGTMLFAREISPDDKA